MSGHPPIGLRRGARLTPQQRGEIAARFAAGEKGTALAQEFDIDANYPARLARRAGFRRRPRSRPLCCPHCGQSLTGARA
jgi:hypothetical protein